MKIAVGTKSENKIRFLQQVLDKLGITAELYCYDVSSGISEQPLSIDETKLGAKNRSLKVLSQYPIADLAIGLEGGLVYDNLDSTYLCIANIIYKNNNYTGVSHQMKIPNEIGQEVKQDGLELSEQMIKYQQEGKYLDILTDDLISRESMFTSAIENVFKQLEI